MKRTERRHLKQNELQRFAVEARQLVEGRKREIQMALIAVVALAAIGLGYFGWREHVESRAHDLFAQAVTVQTARIDAPGTPPAAGGYSSERARTQAAVAKFKAVADRYPSTNVGVFARYQQAVNLVALGDTTQAAAAYQQVIDRSGNGFYGQMARLGLAEAQSRAGQYDPAINTFKELAQRKDGPLPVDGILMQLARTYRVAGKRAEAQQTLNRLVQEYPESPFTPEAKRELDSLAKVS
jgi:TolA-binding protein